jgi:hypothetical protein
MLNLHELSHIYQLHLENIELEKEANKLINGLPDTLAAKLEHLALRDCSLVETLQDVQWARFNCLKVCKAIHPYNTE